MSLSPSLRPTREGPLLMLALALVLTICIPLYQMFAPDSGEGQDSLQVVRIEGRKLTTTDGKGASERTYTIPNDAQVSCDEKDCKLADLKKDLFVRITTKEGDPKTVARVEAFTAPPPARESNTATQRLRHIFLGPEQIACYCSFMWGVFVLVSRWLEVRRQRRVFDLDLLPTEPGSRILPEDARPLQRKLDQQTRNKPYILANMIRLALGKYGITHSGQDVSEAVRTQADVDMSRLVAGMATLHFLVWAIPALGFLGTVRGLGLAMEHPLQAIRYLYMAFDATLVAISLSLPLTFLLHAVQRDEETLVVDCQQYCLEHLVARLYNVEPEHGSLAAQEPVAGRVTVPALGPRRSTP